MWRKILELFSHKGIVLLALLVLGGPIVALKLDPRWLGLVGGVIFALAGMGNFMVAGREQGKFLRGMQKSIGIFVAVVGIFMVVVVIIMFAVGQKMTVAY
jgi:hypothetical protein